MDSISSKFNFSATKDNDNAIKIKKWANVNYYETLCLYCANNDININEYCDFDSSSEIMADHGQLDKSTDYYYFWID